MSHPDRNPDKALPETVTCPITGQASSTCALDPFDRGYISKNYFQLGCQDLLRDVLGIFSASALQKIERLRDALEGGDMVSMARLAHGLKGEAGSAGATIVRQLAARLEDAASKHEIDTIHDTLFHLEREVHFAVGAAVNEFGAQSPALATSSSVTSRN